MVKYLFSLHIHPIFNLKNKKQMKKLLLSIAALALFAQGFAQAKRNCGSHEHHLQMLQNDPAYVIAHEQIEKQNLDFESNAQKKKRSVKVWQMAPSRSSSAHTQ